MSLSQQKVVKRLDSFKVAQFNKDECVGIKSKERFCIDIPNPQNLVLKIDSTLKSFKGAIYSIFPISNDQFYYGEFSDIMMASFSAPTKRMLVHKSLNYIFDSAVDYKGRLVFSEGFGYVRVCENKKNIFTAEEMTFSSRL